MPESEPASGGVLPSTRLARPRRILWLMVPLMIVQGSLGIFVNLFVAVAHPSDISTVLPVVFSNAVLATHFVVAFLLVALSAFLIVVSRGSGVVGLRPGAAGLVAIFATTAYLGYHFVASQDNSYSFGMEMGFFAALLLLIVLLRQTGSLALPGPVPGATAVAPSAP